MVKKIAQSIPIITFKKTEINNKENLWSIDRLKMEATYLSILKIIPGVKKINYQKQLHNNKRRMKMDGIQQLQQLWNSYCKLVYKKKTWISL